MEDISDVLRFMRSSAREEEGADGGGEVLRSLVEAVRGRCDTQSCTRSETLGFEIRLCVFLEVGFVVIIMVGCDVYGVEGR